MAKTWPTSAALTDVVWLQTSFIGDIVLTTAALMLLKTQRPELRQHLITTKIGADLLQAHPALSSVHIFAKGQQPTLTAMRQTVASVRGALPTGHHAVTLQVHRSLRSTLLAQWLGLPVITYRETAGAFLASAVVDRVAVLHEAQRIALLLAPLGISRTQLHSAQPMLSALPLAEAAGWQQQLRAWRGRVVAVAPGSVWGTKRWPEASYAALLRHLLGRPELLVLLLGSPDEAALAGRVAAAAGAQPRLINLAGQTTFADLRQIYPRLALLVANDSSPVHMAAAFTVPTVALFGATVPGMGFGPLAPRSRSLGIDLACRPCSDHGPQVCPLGHFKCMRELGVETVSELCLSLLAC